ncbi:MAG: anhydro-N-acetylmuramic acid kinase [Bacilli bacterium]|nr:anhydro-N-acetylmuramic acid kinase [Bacilli bacterium]
MFEIINKKILSIGLMSGTSLDGVDVALVEHYNNTHKLLKFKSYPYSNELKEKILKASNLDTSNIQLICSLNKELGIVYKDAVEQFLVDTNTNIDDIYFISNHGQTVWHNPIETKDFKSSTLQLGDASVLAYHFNKIVVYDFRSLDISAGGIGAPLVPIVNYLLFKELAPVIFLNIGGISNITYISNTKDVKDVVAFDTGPGNMVIDGLMKELYDLPYDDEGKTAFKGMVSLKLLSYLLDDEYYNLDYPKSTGREKYSKTYICSLLEYAKELNLNKEDIIATATYLTAYVTKMQIKKYFKDFNGTLLVSGGGAFNKYILESLKDEKYTVKTVDEQNINSEGLEAYSFSILGYLRLTNQASNLMKVTGANSSVSLGSIILPPRI